MSRKVSRLTQILAGLIALFSWRVALAEQGRLHDGVFLRLAAGGAIAIDPARLTSPGLEVSGTPGGGGLALDVALGGSVSPGFVLGGGAFLHHVPSPTADDMDATLGGVVNLNGDVAFDGLTFALLAPFVDYYPDPRKGLHLLAAAGLGVLAMGQGRLRNSDYVPFKEHGATGASVLAGVGYEWWVSERWSLGVLGRVTYGALSGEADNGVAWRHHLWVPALSLTATMN